MSFCRTGPIRLAAKGLLVGGLVLISGKPEDQVMAVVTPARAPYDPTGQRELDIRLQNHQRKQDQEDPTIT